MKFKSIKLHNFMRYKGDNEIKFSTDPVKNVTIVLGNNTFGKTTLAQAFRWGLYESFNDTNYSKKKDIVLLNNEVIAEMSASATRDVAVEIVVDSGTEKIRFVRKAVFNRKTSNLDDYEIKQLGTTQLTMQIMTDGVWGDVISNTGENIDSKKYKAGCIQEAIDNMFPLNLSNYFFFDGERWNDLKSKTDDIRDSVNTILGVSGLIEMKKHLKDNRTNAIAKLRSKIQGASGEYDRLQKEIDGLDDRTEECNNRIKEIEEGYRIAKQTYESTNITINDNRKVEEDQKQYNALEKDIQQNETFKESYYAMSFS